LDTNQWLSNAMIYYNENHILVIDIEATCWEGKIPPGQQNEIIEIGICLLDKISGERVMSESILVKPISEISDDTKRCVWASYGAYDKKQFTRECQAKGIEYPFAQTHINVKAWFARQFNVTKPVGMAQALQILGFPLIGTHHRGVDDAWNIANILAWLLEHQQ
jgi:inhibitor of KinA sporulation pathway (predicted exonuclease)